MLNDVGTFFSLPTHELFSSIEEPKHGIGRIRMHPQEQPQPPLPLTISSVLMIAVAMLMAGGLISIVYSTDEIGILLGFLFLPFPLAFIFFQYRGVFQKQPEAAGLAGVMLFSCGLIFSMIAPIGILASIAFKSWSVAWMVVAFGLPWLALFFYPAVLNFNWARGLQVYYAENKENPPQMRFSLRELFGLMTLVAVIAWLSVTLFR